MTRSTTKGSGSLTDVRLRALAKNPPAHQIDIPDGATPGLSARVTKNGHITWSLRLRVAGEGGQSKRGRRAKGQQYRLSLGSYPAVKIKDARATAAAYLAEADAGSHPVRALERKAVGRHDTLGRLVETYLAEYAVNLKGLPNAKSVLRGHMVPKWGKLPADTIDEHDVARLLSEIAKGTPDPETGEPRPRPGAAAECRKWGSMLFAWAKQNGHAHRNPFENAKNPVKSKPRQRFLDMSEARAAWDVAATLEPHWRDILRLLLLTGCRHQNIAQACWSWIDLEAARMEVPPEDFKSERRFLVPLSAEAVVILRGIPRHGSSDWVFTTTAGDVPVAKVPSKIMNKLRAAVAKKLEREPSNFTIHDFRRTVRTHLSRLGISEVVGELAIGHGLRGLAATYNVYDFETEKRDALEKWGAELLARNEQSYRPGA